MRLHGAPADEELVGDVLVGKPLGGQPQYLQRRFVVSSPVGSFGGAEYYSTRDLAGNVLEWCADFYGARYYAEAPTCNPQGPATGSYRVLRGGSWGYGGPILSRSAARYWDIASRRYPYYGIRGVVNLG